MNILDKTVLLTGATGFLGSHLLERLLSEGFKVIILKRSFSNTWRIDHLNNKIKSYNIDHVEIESVFKDQKIDIIIHTAANYGRNDENLSSIIATNITFGIKILELSILYDVDMVINTDTIMPRNTSFYTLSKKQFSEFCRIMSNRVGLKFFNLKLEHLYGPKDDGNKFVTMITRQLLKDFDCIDLTKGEQKRDFIYVNDVIDLFILLVEKKDLYSNNYHEFDVGTGRPIEIRHFVEKIYKLVSDRKEIHTKLNFGNIPYREYEPMVIIENLEPVEALGWYSKISLEEGLMSLINYEQENI